MSEHFRICPICEAACGLKVSADGREVLEIRANSDDVFSTGHVCAKGIALKDLDADPDRLRTPLIREGDGFREATWQEAFDFISTRLHAIRATFGDTAVATYMGNPTAHNVGMAMSMGTWMSALGSPQVFSAGTVDQIPKHLACELMFGNDLAIAVPDIQRCDYLVMLGANPVVSNGSLWVVPKIRDKLRSLRDRGGKLVTIDPRRTETARLADTHLFIEPGADAWLLIGLIKTLAAHGRQPDDALGAKGFADLLQAVEHVSLADVASHTGVAEEDLRALAQGLNEASHPVLYGRIGTTLQRFGTLTSFLIEVVNAQLGALDQAGGAMFPEQPFYSPRAEPGVRWGRYHTRVSNLPEVLGQIPVAALAEEITTPGDGQIRALFCCAGNPVVSNPDSEKLSNALAQLDLLVCLDIYQTETTRHADVILPGTSPFEDSHYDQFLGSMGYKNTARYSPPVFSPQQPTEWDIGLTLSYIAAQGRAPSSSELAEFEDQVIAQAATALVNDPDCDIHGADVQEIMGKIEPDRGVERLLDLNIRAGRYGDHFKGGEGLTLKRMAQAPNGIELGELRSNRLAELASHTIDFAPELILQDIDRLEAHTTSSQLRLVGRRTTRTNNSWLRNLAPLNVGRALCTLQIHPDDAARHNIADGGEVTVISDTAEITARAELTEDVKPGIVSLPHGFSEADLPQRNAASAPNYNALTATKEMDYIGGTSALNGVEVVIKPADSDQQLVR